MINVESSLNAYGYSSLACGKNTSLTFKQIAEFCKLHEVEIQGIADGEVAKGIVGYNPIISGQLTKEKLNFPQMTAVGQTNIIDEEVEIKIRRVKLKNMFHFYQKDKISLILFWLLKIIQF